MMQETVILCVILFVCGIVVCQDILDPTVTNSSTVFQNSTSPVPDTTTALRGTEEDYIPVSFKSYKYSKFIIIYYKKFGIK